MWDLMNKINKQNRNRLIDTENRLTAVRGEGVGGLGEKVKGLSQKTATIHRHRQQYGDYLRERRMGGSRKG